MAEPLADEDDDVEGRHGPPLSAFPAADKEFFDFVENGSVDDVRNFLDANRDFDIDVVNFQGLNALYVAVQEKNVGMVEFLLSRDIDVKDAGLHAVRVNEPRIVVMILDKLNAVTPAGEYVGVSGSSDFPDDTTPLVVAAQSGHYEMVKLLLDRKHRIAKPHPPSCNCEEICKPQRAAEDTLTLTKKRLNLYRAVANPAYICQTSEDPFLVAFALTKELDRAASYESEFYYQYKSLSQEIRKFTGELIGFARTASEVEAVLKRSNGVPGHSAKFFYPRLLLAMDCKQKEFVAHPNVQQVISSHWVGDWYEWKIRSSFGKVFTVLPRVLLLPVVVAAILLAPNSGRSKRWQTPINKFLSFIASYVVFLVFVFLQSNVDKTNQTRGPPSSGYEAFLVIYVASYAWSAFRLCVIYGLRRYLRTYWNWYETAMLVLFILTFIFWIVAALDVRANGQRDLERKYWHKYDPTLIGEGVFCLATIMAFFKLSFVCQLDYHLGPLQISLGKMTKDVAKFIVIFGIVLFAFSSGLAKLYQYYDEMIFVDDDSKLKTQQVGSFVSFASSIKTLFWAIFCMSPIESADVVIENLPGDTEVETIVNQHTFTETIGYVAFAGFEFISVVVMLNMLLACMTNTFTRVTQRVDVEWTFGRTEVYIEFMAQTALPPPFNLIPTPRAIGVTVEFFKVLFKPTPDKRVRWNLKNCCYIEDLGEENKKEFDSVILQLVQRYFRKRAEDADVEDLKKELLELRTILKGALEPE